MSNSFATPWTVAQHSPLSMGILQASILGWVAKSSSRGSSQPRDQTQVSCIAGEFFTVWATREAELQMKREGKIHPHEGGKKSPLKTEEEGFSGGSVVKNPPADAGDMGSFLGLGGSHMPQSN